MMPLLHIEDNRIFTTRGEAFAVFEIESEPYENQSLNIQRNIINTVAHGFDNLSGEFWLNILTRQLSADQIEEKMRQFSEAPIWNAHTKEVKNYLHHLLPFTKVNLLIVPLLQKRFSIDLTSENWKDWVKQAFQGIVDFKDQMTKGREMIPSDSLIAAKNEAEDWYTKLGPLGKVKTANLALIEWWLKKGYFRGLPDPKCSLPDPMPIQAIAHGRQHWIRPSRSIILSLTDVKAREKATRLLFEHADDLTSHQTYFSTVNVPSPIPPDDPTGREWIYGITENLNFPVDVAVHIKVEEHRKALDNLGKKIKTATAQYEEWQDNGEEIPLEIEENMAAIPTLKKKLRSTQPLLHVKTVFALGASDEKTLKKRITSFKNAAQNYHLLIQAPGDMKPMFQSFYPFGDPLPSSWEIPMDPGVLGASALLGTKALGDPFGFWLGRQTEGGRTVWCNPKRPATELNSTNAIMIAGTLGSGKSALLKYLSTILASWGAYGLLVDPKGDTDPMLQLPFDIKMLKFIRGENTRFSPFKLGTVEDARAMMDITFNPKSEDDKETVINLAVERLYKNGCLDMNGFYQALMDIANKSPQEYLKEIAFKIAQKVQLMEQHEIGEFMFGTGDNDSFNAQFIIAVTRDLTMPARNHERSTWTESQRYSVAIMYAVASLGLRKLMKLPRHILKFLSIDEKWVLDLFEQGVRLQNEALRFSRSENMIPIFASQNPTDHYSIEQKEDTTGLFAWKFMLHLESSTQVQAAMELLGMQDEYSSVWDQKFADYSKGKGMCRDPEGRIAEIQVEVVPQILMKYFDSNPDNSKIKHEQFSYVF